MKTLFNKFFIILVIVFSFFGLFNISNADINLDMKINSDGLLDANDNNIKNGIGYGISVAGGLNTKNSFQKTLKNILSIVLGFAGTISLGLVVYGGVNIIFAKGNKEKYSSNVKVMLTGAVAFLIILFAYAISRFILNFMGNIAGA